MDVTHYIAMMQDAFTKLEQLYVERESIDSEIMKLEQLIGATANMLPAEVQDLASKRIAVLQELYRVREAGLTNAIRATLRGAAGDWLTVTNVRDQLIKAGFDFSTYSTNPLASISAILRRLKSEDVETRAIENGVTAYRWKMPKGTVKNVYMATYTAPNKNNALDRMAEMLVKPVKKKKEEGEKEQ
jgi:hypothetical protein